MSGPATGSVRSRTPSGAAPVEVIVREVNQYLRGWANYFRYGNSRLHFTRITTYALRRLVLFVAKRHKRASGYGMTVVAYVARTARTGQPRPTRRHTQPLPGLAGQGGTECRR